MKKVHIIGAGISGLSAARMLMNKHHVTVSEQGEKPGGLIGCNTIDGNLYHRVGGHVFNTKNDQILKWFQQFFDLSGDFNLLERNAKILLDGNLISYPIENHIYQLGEYQAKRIIRDLLGIKRIGKISAENFGDYLKDQFGQTLYDIYFQPYISKVWPISLDQIPLKWLNGKLPMPDIDKIIEDNILRKGEDQFVHARFYYPKSGGSQFIADTLAKDIPIQYNEKITSIKRSTNKLIINDSYQADYLIYTGDVRELSHVLEVENNKLPRLLEDVSSLLSTSTTNVLCLTDPVHHTWMYIPDPHLKPHRIIYTGNFSPANNSDPDRPSCVVEFSGNVSRDEIEKTIKQLPGNLQIIDDNYQNPSYVVRTFKTEGYVSALKNKLLKMNIFLVGRFAEWKYHNMDNCMESAANAVKQIDHA